MSQRHPTGLSMSSTSCDPAQSPTQVFDMAGDCVDVPVRTVDAPVAAFVAPERKVTAAQTGHDRGLC
jgi:hypothetical protein